MRENNNKSHSNKEDDTTILLACDLDRTVIPNGSEPLSPDAMEKFSSFVSRSNVRLAYISGRHLTSIQKVIQEFKL